MDKQELLDVIAQTKEDKTNSLYLSNKELTSLPVEIGELIDLQILTFEKNSIKELPSSIGNLSKLEELHLGNNQIASLL